MRWGYASHVIGLIILCVGMCMLLPLFCALIYWDSSILPLLGSALLSIGVGTVMHFSLRRHKVKVINHREGMAIVALGWAAAGLFGALPFYFGGFESFTDSVFESFSGFTTTGSSILNNIEALPKGLLMWRSLTHWLGGMGIIVLSLAILPFLGVGGMQLYKAEVPGPVPDKLRPRIKDTAISLWQVYVLFTFAEVVLLFFGGMEFFDSVCHSFGTLATGGFSTKNTSIAYYNSAYIDYVITFFMFLAGINFSLHYQVLRGRPLALWKDPEFRFFGTLFVVFTAICTIAVYGNNYQTLEESFRYTVFQVASIVTTTGYATADYEVWPYVTQAILLFCMFMGGSAGSTSGGMKCMRLMVLFKQAYRELFRLIHPRAIRPIKLGDQMIKGDIIDGVWGYFVLFMGLFILSGVLLASMGLDIMTSFSAVVACIGNIGPGLGSVGPAENYAHIPWAGKWLLTFCMLLGRFEIYTVIVLLVPEFWSK